MSTPTQSASTSPWLQTAGASLQAFLKLEASGGIVLVVAAALAMLVANSPLTSWYEALLQMPVSVRVGPLALDKPLLLWVNDGLMAVFFLLVGLELKREVLEGHLASLRRASLPAFAALGGMAAPALIYAWINRHHGAALQGWAIPAATDIAFALGVLALLGRRVPSALKVFLLSVAIFDDLGAIVIIAAFYTAKLSYIALGTAAALTVGLWILNRLRVRRTAAYFLLGVPLWIAVLKSGVHATLAGVVLALFIPLRADDGDPSQRSPLRELEHGLHPWVAFGVLPLFAFANAGVKLGGLDAASLLHSVPLGIAAGLFLGNQIGIIAASAVAVGLRLAALPAGIRWIDLYGTALLCGIGFTMSLFVASLAFEPGTYQGLERLGILAGSLLSGIAGFAVLRIALPHVPAHASAATQPAASAAEADDSSDRLK